jgi:hypothetical protein
MVGSLKVCVRSSDDLSAAQAAMQEGGVNARSQTEMAPFVKRPAS